MDLALQRCRTAREAIHFIDKILAQHGYASSGESISIADTQEVWLMELVSKGKGEKGVVWVARRVPDDSACSHANQARIRTWPRNDPENTLFANDTVSFAIRKGLYLSVMRQHCHSFHELQLHQTCGLRKRDGVARRPTTGALDRGAC